MAALSEIVGQEAAKRALVIAAAGGHNLLLNGPPGTGKSMLAKALPLLLPPLSLKEILEVTHLHSLISTDYDQLITARPFRAPHHSSSHVAITGGGANLRPGEITLSHHGILFLDEMPEFNRPTIEALRQPLEDRVITVARAKDTITYPADFMLVATANPCPCGYYGTGRPCNCQPHRIAQYREKLSGPIMDRIDLYVDVEQIDHSQLLQHPVAGNGLYKLPGQIAAARNMQKQRFNSSCKLNAAMTNRDIRQKSQISSAAQEILNQAATRLHLSARSYMRLIKVARTIADLDRSATLELPHLTEALQFRPRGPETVG